MMRNRLCAVAAAIVLVLGPLVVGAEDAPPPADSTKHTLRYRFVPDEALRYEIANHQTLELQAGGVAESVESEEISTKQFVIKNTDSSGAADLEVTIERVRLSARGPDANFTWDSAEETPAPAELRGVKGTIGTPLGTITVTPLGKIIDAQQRGAGSAAPQVKEGQLDLLPLLPEGPVAVGESWKQEFTLDIAIEAPPYKRPVTLQRKFTLLSVEKGIATVDERTFVLTPPRDAKEEAQLLKRTPIGTFTIDVEQGRLLQRELKIDSRVVGFQGPQTEMKVVGTRVDRYLPPAQTAAADSETTTR
jgi:hypothetical protein